MPTIGSVARQLLAVAAVCNALPAAAAAINGTLTHAKVPVANASVHLQCGSVSVDGRADPQGNYSLSISASGLCTLTVNERSAATVLLGKNPVRYDFDVPVDGAPLAQH